MHVYTLPRMRCPRGMRCPYAREYITFGVPRSLGRGTGHGYVAKRNRCVESNTPILDDLIQRSRKFFNEG